MTLTNLRGQPSLFKKQAKNSKGSNATETLQNLRLENSNRIKMGQLNINSIRNKFEMLTSFITNKIDFLLYPETKIGEMFLLEQFLVSGFAKPLRFGRNSSGGGIKFLLELIFLSGC